MEVEFTFRIRGFRFDIRLAMERAKPKKDGE